MREQRMTSRQLDRSQDSLYSFEHWTAWLLALGSIVAGLIGMLGGFGVIDLRGAVAEVDIPGISENDQALTLFRDNFWDGAMLLFAGITGSVLAFTFHANDHHRTRDLSTIAESERGLWAFEHWTSYLFALGAVALVIIGLLSGFQAFSSDNDQRDGLIWIWGGLGMSVLTMTLHSVRHHQAVAEEDYIVSMVEERLGGAGRAPTTPVRAPGQERIS